MIYSLFNLWAKAKYPLGNGGNGEAGAGAGHDEWEKLVKGAKIDIGPRGIIFEARGKHVRGRMIFSPPLLCFTLWVDELIQRNKNLFGGIWCVHVKLLPLSLILILMSECDMSDIGVLAYR